MIEKFVGLLVNDKTILPEGSHIVEKALKQPPMKMLGHVTSSYYSPTLDLSNRSGDVKRWL